MKNKCYFGDVFNVLPELHKQGIQAQTCITSPPYYGLRDYGMVGQLGNEKSVDEYVDNLVSVFRHVWNILADDGTLWLNLGDSYYNYRPGKGSRQSKQSIAGQKVSEVEDCNRRGLKLDGLKEKDLIGIPWRVAFALQSDGWYLRQDIIWHKPNPMPESVKDRCTKAHEYIFLLTKNKKYYYDNDAIKEPCSDSTMKDIKSRKKMNNKGDFGNSRPDLGRSRHDYVPSDGMRNKRSVWTTPVKPFKGAHFAVFPEALIKPCVLAGSKQNDIVLDPFFGSGTTGVVAAKLNRNFIGCELNAEYKSIQDDRLSNIQLTI